MSSPTRPVPQPHDAKPNTGNPADGARSRKLEERDWYASSFELARGLVVEEIPQELARELFGVA